jgi:Fe-S oxidoreductase/nitrate reductase gamma subunit
MEDAAREIYWNIDRGTVWIMYVLLGLSMALCAAGVAFKVRGWMKGRPEPGFEKAWGRRLWGVVTEVLGQVRVRNRPLPGFFHSAFFWSFLALFIVTLVVFVEADFGLRVFHGFVYKALSLLADAAGLLFMIGIAVAAVRRFILRPGTVERRRLDWLLYIGLFFIVASGFLLEALRIAATADPWAAWSPVGWALSIAVRPLAGHMGIIHAALWWSHLAVVAVLIATLPWSRMFHLFVIPANVFTRDLRHKGSVERRDVEPLMEQDDFTFGLGKAEELTWKQRMDLDACTGCGRCEEVCPAFIAGGSLSPRKFITLLKRSASGGDGFAGLTPDGMAAAGMGNGIDENLIWYCRTCYACAEVCPSMISHVRFMIELRQNRTMIEGDVPSDASRALQSMQTRGNPWGPQMERTEWLASNNVKVLRPGDETDVLYWLGCCTSYDQTKQRVAIHMVSLMRQAGVDFAILGDEEVCCGDPARLLGDEGIFQEIVRSQIEKLKAVRFKRIVTHCPHCYFVLKNEYRWFGMNMNVVHHSEFLSDLVSRGRLKLERPLGRTIVFHDPCYLGRYQDIYDAPRRLLTSIPDVKVVEMAHHHKRSLCCGGGGGHYWMDLKNGRRLNDVRVEEAAATGADTLAVACVYCMQMMEDSVKNKDLDEKMKVLDIADILVEAAGVEKAMEPLKPKGKAA